MQPKDSLSIMFDSAPLAKKISPKRKRRENLLFLCKKNTIIRKNIAKTSQKNTDGMTMPKDMPLLHK